METLYIIIGIVLYSLGCVWIIKNLMDRNEESERGLLSMIRELTGKVMARNYDQYLAGEMAMKDDEPVDDTPLYTPAEDLTPEEFQKKMINEGVKVDSPHND